MTHAIRARALVSLLTIVIVAGGRPAHAQTVQLSQPSLLRPFADTILDLKHLSTRDNLDWLAAGLGAALVAHRADTRISRGWTEPGSPAFKPGAIVGGTPLQLGAAFATFAIGRATNNRRAVDVGSDLIRAQLLAEIMTTGLKQSVRRDRPAGTGFSFPSGHTTVTFASATVLQRHFGWKVGFPSYAVATYVAASRVEMKRHYLSDVAFGAALGIVAGRTVTIGHGRRLMLEPILTPHGGGANFRLMGK
jgi:membrane-associated phospholipid phosphatase